MIVISQSSELNEQTTKISRLIKQLKQQERAYIELLQRTVVSISANKLLWFKSFKCLLQWLADPALLFFCEMSIV